MTDVLFLHWGWATPGVPRCNREMQEDKYFRFLEAERGRGSCFMITQPAWALDHDLSDAVRRTTTDCPEPERHNGPFTAAGVATLRQAVQEGRVSFVVYPYSGAVVEGMVGEAVHACLRLARDVVSAKLGFTPRDFFIHDGITRLNWNIPAILPLARLLGFARLYGTFTARLEGPDGSELTMHGDLLAGDFEFRRSEMPHGPEAIAACREELGEVRFIPLAEALERLGEPDRRVLAARTWTKGWYGGAPRSLEMQAALRRHDLLLPRVAARAILRGEDFDPTDHWKRSLIMQDTHLQWFLNDWPRWYLPQARQLEAELWTESGPCAVPLNVGGGRRTPTSANDRKSRRPAAASHIVSRCASIANDRIRVALGPAGEIEAVTDDAGRTLYQGAANVIERRHMVADDRPVDLRLGETWEPDFCGNLELFCEVDVPTAGRWQFELECPRGMTPAIGPVDVDWTSATNLHWGGGQPSANRDPEYTGIGALDLPAGRVRLRLFAVADRGFRLDRALLRRGTDRVDLAHWTGRTTSRWAVDPVVVDRVESGPGEVRFHGHTAVCTTCLTVRLAPAGDRVDVHFARTYPEPVREGFVTAPLPAAIGSYLGSTCERPYAPAWTVAGATWRDRTIYTSDQPYGFVTATDQRDAWFTSGFHDWFDGIAPFLGVFAGIAEAPDGRVAMITDGHGHFFRRRDPGGEQLGLSLGASVIHPMTQGYRMPIGSYWEKIGRRPGGHDYEHAYEDSSLACVRGTIEVGWSWLFGDTVADRRRLWEERLLVNAPPVDLPGLALDGADVVLTALERRDGGVVARLANLAGEPRAYSLAHPWGAPIAGELPPKAIREVELTADA